MRLVLLLLAPTFLFAPACEPDPVLATEADEPAIWAAALAFESAADPDAAPLLLNVTVDALTSPFQADDLAARLPGVDASTIDSLLARAQGDAAEVALDVDANGFTVIAEEDAPEASPEAPIVGASRAGFGLDEALVYIESVCGNVCATGSIVVVERDAGGWRASTSVLLWGS